MKLNIYKRAEMTFRNGIKKYSFRNTFDTFSKSRKQELREQPRARVIRQELVRLLAFVKNT